MRTGPAESLACEPAEEVAAAIELTSVKAVFRALAVLLRDSTRARRKTCRAEPLKWSGGLSLIASAAHRSVA